MGHGVARRGGGSGPGGQVDQGGGALQEGLEAFDLGQGGGFFLQGSLWRA